MYNENKQKWKDKIESKQNVVKQKKMGKIN